MKKTQLPSKREIIPTSPESAPKLRATFTDEFKRDAVARLRAPKQKPRSHSGRPADDSHARAVVEHSQGLRSADHDHYLHPPVSGLLLHHLIYRSIAEFAHPPIQKIYKRKCPSSSAHAHDT
jgi:hypothetical protein